MGRILIDTGEFTTALSDHDNAWVLDLQSGEVLMEEWIRDPGMGGDIGLEPDGAPADAGDGDEDLDPLESDRFRSIGSIPSHLGFRWMEHFAQEQDDGGVRRHLVDALDRPRPFRRFRDALQAFPAVRDAWHRYEEAQLRQEAEGWLRAEGIDAELVDRHLPAGAPGGGDPVDG